MEVLEVEWEKCGTEPADDYTFFYGNGNDNHHLGTGSLVHKGIISEVKRVSLLTDVVWGWYKYDLEF